MMERLLFPLQKKKKRIMVLSTKHKTVKLLGKTIGENL